MTEKTGYYFDVVAFRNSDKVRLMDFETRSVYRDVLDEIWVTGSVPDDPASVARLIQAPGELVLKVWPAIIDCLILVQANAQANARYTSERMEQERKKRNAIRRKRKKFGQLGGKTTQAKKRVSPETTEDKGNTAQAIASTLLEQTSSSAKAIQVQEQVQEQVLKKRTRSAKAAEYTPQFLAFWEISTMRGSKFEAFEEWQRLKPDPTLQQVLAAKMQEAKSSRDWTECEPRFIPHVRKWLRTRGWEVQYRSVSRQMTSKPVAVC